MDTVSPEQYGLPRPSAAQKLTPLDVSMPQVYGTRWTLCFALPSGADPVQVFENLRTGLARTILSIPWLAGRIGPEKATGTDEDTLGIVDSSDGVLFRYQDLTGHLPAYAEMRAHDFPLRQLPAARLFPVGLLPEAGAPARVFAAQANFVAGGLLLGVAMHHAAGDAGALQTVLQTWARDTKAAATDAPAAGAVFSAYNALANDRRVLMVAGDPPAPAGEEEDEYVLKPLSPPAAASLSSPPSLSLPPMEARLFVFSPAVLADLKAAAGAYSRHDALCGFLWCAMTRARRLADGAGADTALALAVNVRARARPPLPPDYLGNASMLGLTARQAAGALTVAAAAAAVRAAVDRYNGGGGDEPDHVARVVARLATGRYTMAPVAAVLGPDVVVTSWADVAIYATDWGRGLGGAPDRFRATTAAEGDAADGIVFLLPRRPDGVLEVQVGLESGAMARLLADDEFARLAGGPL